MFFGTACASGVLAPYEGRVGSPAEQTCVTGLPRANKLGLALPGKRMTNKQSNPRWGGLLFTVALERAFLVWSD